MSRYEQVVIDTALPFDQVVDTVARLLDDGRIIESAGAEAVIANASGVTVMVEKADLEDSHGMPLSQFSYVLDIFTAGAEEDGFVSQERAARDIFHRLVEGTGWRLLLAFNDLQREVSRREALAAT